MDFGFSENPPISSSTHFSNYDKKIITHEHDRFTHEPFLPIPLTLLVFYFFLGIVISTIVAGISIMLCMTELILVSTRT
jgi:hypothetical protein